MVSICPRCQDRYARDSMNSDFIHVCTDNVVGAALRDEDILVIGTWEDYTGSATVQANSNSVQGTQNKLWGTRAAVDGAPNLPDFTVRGKSKSLYRTRQHLEYIEKKGDPQKPQNSS